MINDHGNGDNNGSMMISTGMFNFSVSSKLLSGEKDHNPGFGWRNAAE